MAAQVNFLCLKASKNQVGGTGQVKARRVMVLTFAVAIFPYLARTQSTDGSKEPPAAASTPAPPAAPPDAPAPQSSPAYTPPTHQMLFRIYMFDAMGPYPIAGAFVAAAFNQGSNSPPEWGQGIQGYTERFMSDYGIALARTSTRYLLAKPLKEDTLYYSCECTGAFPRLGHAVVTSFTARRGQDGHQVFSVPALVAPYAGTMTAVYGWYPRRYGAKDAFRMGNYGMLYYVGGNIGLEFLYSGPHALLKHMRSPHSAPVGDDSGPVKDSKQ
jgi:hypothetical protein